VRRRRGSVVCAGIRARPDRAYGIQLAAPSDQLTGAGASRLDPVAELRRLGVAVARVRPGPRSGWLACSEHAMGRAATGRGGGPPHRRRLLRDRAGQRLSARDTGPPDDVHDPRRRPPRVRRSRLHRDRGRDVRLRARVRAAGRTGMDDLFSGERRPHHRCVRADVAGHQPEARVGGVRGIVRARRLRRRARVADRDRVRLPSPHRGARVERAT